MAIGLFKWLSISILAAFHPFYVSVTEINHNATDKSLEVSCKVFTEDLEQILAKNNNTPINLSDEKQHAANEKRIFDYLSRHLILKVDGKNVAMTSVGFEIEREAVWAYCQVDNISSVKTLEVDNSILYDFIESQINLMHVTVGGKRKSQKLDFPKRNVTFSY